MRIIEMELAAYMNQYGMRGQHGPDRAMTRYRHDVSKMVENTEISTGPGRWALGVPNAYGNAAFVPDVTTINQKWGASHIMTSTKTDTESDLKNLGRPTVRTTCGQYQPEQGASMAARLTAMPETSFPQTASHLVDPPCTLRGTGINRWEHLCENPQENVMVPFEYLVDSRHASKDAVYQTAGLLPRQLICGKMYVDPAVPVPRQRKPNEPAAFNDFVPGASQRMGSTPVARETPRGLPPSGANHPMAPPVTYANPAERERAATGVLAPPPWPTIPAH
jgi:hypothetical protein